MNKSKTIKDSVYEVINLITKTIEESKRFNYNYNEKLGFEYIIMTNLCATKICAILGSIVIDLEEEK